MKNLTILFITLIVMVILTSCQVKHSTVYKIKDENRSYYTNYYVINNTYDTISFSEFKRNGRKKFYQLKVSEVKSISFRKWKN